MIEAGYLTADAHTAGGPDPAGRTRCALCRYVWPCPTIRMTVPDQTDDEAEVVALVDVGWTLWRRGPEPGPYEQAPSRTGGIVVGWAEHPEQHRIFACLDWSHGQPVWHHVNSTEIDPRDCKLPNASVLRSQARTLARLFAAKKGVVSGWDRTLLETAHTLVCRVA